MTGGGPVPGGRAAAYDFGGGGFAGWLCFLTRLMAVSVIVWTREMSRRRQLLDLRLGFIPRFAECFHAV